MLDFGFYNMDCMDGMKEFPDGYFDLAIVDPPYGDGGGTWTNGTRFGQRFDRYAGCLATASTARPTAGGVSLKNKSSEPAEHGQRNSAKILLRGTLHREKNTSTNFSAFHAVKSYGGELFSITRDAVLYHMA